MNLKCLLFGHKNKVYKSKYVKVLPTKTFKEPITILTTHKNKKFEVTYCLRCHQYEAEEI